MTLQNIFGNKGGGKGGGGATEAPNSLRSAGTARIVDLISEGPVVGLVDGLKSVYLDDTPIQNSDDSYNFEGVIVHERFGTPNQSHIRGFSEVENEVTVNEEVTVISPKVIQINDDSVDSVRVKIGVSALFIQSTEDGSMTGHKVRMKIEVKTNTGSYTHVRTVKFDGKTTSPYQRSFLVDLPPGGAPWSIKVTRLTPDTEDSNITDTTVFFAYTEITEAKLAYSDSAIIGLEVDSKKNGGGHRTRTYKYRGLITKVPSNYDPITRTYSSDFWNGTFKLAWHSNPAWVLYDLATNKRYGLGDYIDEASIDKWALYTIGRYCDQMVPDGKGGVEPRYSFNGVIQNRQEAAKVLDMVAATFRGMIYWGAGAIAATQDAPAATSKLVTPANVIGGNFEYVGSALRTRSSSVSVAWNDPADLGRESVLLLQKDSLVRKFGDRRKRLETLGCTSRGQARRVAEWLLFTEEYETELVTYQASLDHADVRPGHIIAIADPSYAGARFGGRIVSATNSGLVTLDSPVTINAGEDYSMAMVGADGGVRSYPLPLPLTVGTTTTIDFPTFPTTEEVPIAGAMWVLSSSEVEPRLFRVVSNYEKEENVYEIAAVQYRADKYAHVERDVPLDDLEYSFIPKGKLAVPTGLSAIPYRKKRDGSVAKLRFLVGWDAPADPRIKKYNLWVKQPGEPEERVYSGTEPFYEFRADKKGTGDYRFRVNAIGFDGQPSAPALLTQSSGPAYSPPSAPTGWAAVPEIHAITFSGPAHPSVDFYAFRIYGSASAGGPFTQIGETRATTYTHAVKRNAEHQYYHVKAIDYSGDISAPSAVFDVRSERAGAVHIDPRGLNIQDGSGNVVFDHTGEISPAAYVTVGGSTISLSDIAANSLVPSLNFVGEFSLPPTALELGANWVQNSVYRNSVDGKSYVLTGTPLAWQLYLEDGVNWSLSIESTNGTIFRPGAGTSTLIQARVFKNGAEVTAETPAAWFRWRRSSAVPQASPNDDATWNSLYTTGYKQISINVDSVQARATFFCDIISTT